MATKEENFTPQDLEAIGSNILEKNKMPADFMLDAIMNTSLGINFINLAMARSQSKELKNLFDSMSKLEADIFQPEVIEKLSVYDKLNLLIQCRNSFKFRMDYIKDVQKSIDWKALFAEIQKFNHDGINVTTDDKAKKDIKAILARFINTDDNSESKNS